MKFTILIVQIIYETITVQGWKAINFAESELMVFDNLLCNVPYKSQQLARERGVIHFSNQIR